VSVKYGSIELALQTLRGKLFGRSDMDRWQNLKQYEVEWDERTKIIAGLVPTQSRLIEFGAGRRQLETHLDPSCVYFPADLVSRGPDTIVCDLNQRPLPDLRDLKLDIAIFGGVLEYITNLDTLLLWLSQQVDSCIVSYECAESQPKTIKRVRETLKRLSFGWVNTFSESELEDLFIETGFVLNKKITWHTDEGDERIFVFQKYSQHKLASSRG